MINSHYIIFVVKTVKLFIERLFSSGLEPIFWDKHEQKIYTVITNSSYCGHFRVFNQGSWSVSTIYHPLYQVVVYNGRILLKTEINSIFAKKYKKHPQLHKSLNFKV